MKARRAIQLVVGKVVQWTFSIALLLVIWRWVLVPNVSSVFVPKPGPVWSELVTIAKNGTLWKITSTTLSEALVGLVVGTGVGIVLAMAVGLLPLAVGKVIEPVVTGVYAMPKFILAPILFIWFGANFMPRALLVTLAIFPVVAIYTISGIRTTDPDVANMMRLNGANSRQVAGKLLIPHTMGYLTTALVYSIPHALTVAIGAEILFGATNGIGGMLNSSGDVFDAKGVFAALVVGTVLCSIGISLTRIFTRHAVGASGLQGR